MPVNNHRSARQACADAFDSVSLFLDMAESPTVDHRLWLSLAMKATMRLNQEVVSRAAAIAAARHDPACVELFGGGDGP